MLVRGKPALTAGLNLSIAQIRHGPRRYWQFLFVDVTPGPPFSGLEGCDKGVARVMEMSRGVASRRAVAAANVATTQAESEMNPRRAELHALFTTKSASGNRGETAQVLTAHIGPLTKEDLANSTVMLTLDRACGIVFRCRTYSHAS
jgi:hypothetical protein